MNPIDKLKSLLLGLVTKGDLRLEVRTAESAIVECMIRKNILYLKEPGVSSTPVAERNVTVSLTTFGERIRYVDMAVESIMEQTVLPNRIVLWLDHSFDRPGMIPASLRLLEKRGLEIRFCDDIGSATKLIPALKAFPEDIIITVDDDVIYPYDLIDRLLRGHQLYPDAVCSAWLMDIMGGDNGLEMTNAASRRYRITDGPQQLPLALGVAGVLYPPGALHEDVFDIEAMMRVAPKHDDVWFKAMEMRAGTSVLSVGNGKPDRNDQISIAHLYDPKLALFMHNLLEGGDSKALNATFGEYDLVKYYR